MSTGDPTVELEWTARTVRPIIVLYIASIFLGFMGLAHFVFHSVEAVKGLFLAGIGSVAAVIPVVLTRLEYRLSEHGLEKRPLRGKEPRETREVFSWDELSHVTPTSSGFKFYKRFQASSRWDRLLKRNLLGSHSGEFQVEPEDRRRVEAALARHSVAIESPPTNRALDRFG